MVTLLAELAAVPALRVRILLKISQFTQYEGWLIKSCSIEGVNFRKPSRFIFQFTPFLIIHILSSNHIACRSLHVDKTYQEDRCPRLGFVGRGNKNFIITVVMATTELFLHLGEVVRDWGSQIRWTGGSWTTFNVHSYALETKVTDYCTKADVSVFKMMLTCNFQFRQAETPQLLNSAKPLKSKTASARNESSSPSTLKWNEIF